MTRKHPACRRRAAALLAVLLGATLPAHAIEPAQARQLLSRTGFGVTDGGLAALEQIPSYDRAVDRLVADAARHTQADTPPPAWVNDELPRYRKLKDAPPEEKIAFRRQLIGQSIELQGWWMREIVATPQPLAEHMTLFWHNHFTSSLEKVKSPILLYRQNVLLRRYALGNFRELLHAVARDPAMIVYLDNLTNRDAHPNENFARELMELFTLGLGNYSEDDVKQAARAFTGWAVQPGSGEFREVRRWHDGGEKTFLGRRGDFDGDDVLDIILADPRAVQATSRFIVEKLWREFVSATPDEAQVARIAAGFRKDWEIAPVVAVLLKTPQFRDPANAGTLTKSPVELVAGTLVSLQVPVADGRFPAIVAGRLGQGLFNPPNVKGWPGGNAWIDSATLVGREQFIEALTRGFPAPKPAADMAGGAQAMPAANRPPAQAGQDPAIAGLRARIAAQVLAAAQSLEMERYLNDFAGTHTAAQAQALLLPIPPVVPPPEEAAAPDTAPVQTAQALLLDPAYQLK